MVLLPHRYKRKNHHIPKRLRHFRFLCLKIWRYPLLLQYHSVASDSTPHIFPGVDYAVCAASQIICHRSRWLPRRRRSI